MTLEETYFVRMCLAREKNPPSFSSDSNTCKVLESVTAKNEKLKYHKIHFFKPGNIGHIK